MKLNTMLKIIWKTLKGYFYCFYRLLTAKGILLCHTLLAVVEKHLKDIFLFCFRDCYWFKEYFSVTVRNIVHVTSIFLFFVLFS